MASTLSDLNLEYLKKLQSHAATGISFSPTSDKPTCKTCIYVKIAQKHFARGDEKASDSIKLIHSDECEMQSSSIVDSTYFVTFMDD